MATACAVPIDGQNRSLFDAVDDADTDPMTPTTETAIDRYLSTVITDLDEFWEADFPEQYGSRYQPLAEVFPFFASEGRSIRCGSPLPPSAISQNAIYCSAGDYVTWDAEILMPNLNEQFGQFAMGIVLSHEWGHAIQARARVNTAPVVRELQADCFAGAWAGRVRNGESSRLSLTVDEIDGALAGFLLLRDPPGTPLGSRQAHGSAFDRVGAFEEGLTEGNGRCVRYETDGPRALFDIGFTSFEDQQRGGNLPLGEAFDLVVTDLDAFWLDAIEPRTGQASFPVDAYSAESGDVPACPSAGIEVVRYCPDDQSITVEADQLAAIHRGIGDFSIGLLLAREWGRGIVSINSLAHSQREAAVLADCLAGTWAGTLAAGTSATDISLSPGDLDEAVAVMVGRRPADLEGIELSAFDRIRAFRTGFTDDAACLR